MNNKLGVFTVVVFAAVIAYSAWMYALSTRYEVYIYSGYNGTESSSVRLDRWTGALLFFDKEGNIKGIRY